VLDLDTAFLVEQMKIKLEEHVGVIKTEKALIVKEEIEEASSDDCARR